MEHTAIRKEILLSQDSPAICAKKLSMHEADIGLVPVAVIPTLENPQIITPYCIAANGKVATVCLFSEVPIEQIKTVFLDYQSRTSVQLVQILMKEYWNREVVYTNALPGYESQIKGNAAGVIIGDRAIHFTGKFRYAYDLSEIWKLHTGLPFVFAVWISCGSLAADFLERFNSALQFGLEHRKRVSEEYKQLNTDFFSVDYYLNNNIQYELTADKYKALDFFLQKLK